MTLLYLKPFHSIQFHPPQEQKRLPQQAVCVLGNSSTHLHFLPGCTAWFCNAMQSEYMHTYIPSSGNVQCLGDLDNFGTSPIFNIWTSLGPSPNLSYISVLFLRTHMCGTLISMPHAYLQRLVVMFEVDWRLKVIWQEITLHDIVPIISCGSSKALQRLRKRRPTCFSHWALKRTQCHSLELGWRK